jgi:hypothetical protein
MAQQTTDPEWYSIAEQASKETDPAKLTILVAQLCSALDKAENRPNSNATNPANETRSLMTANSTPIGQ